ncbi:MAG: division/cell wall cluster transcriptional repressor MraZ [Oscillospiraceae bacterium]|nr:division/cell wall cluster transcriptional repressor MraZ [Oscillospiraceae bacterium]
MGTYTHTIDAKGRMAFPTKLREQLGDSFVVTVDTSGCLSAYSEEEWQTVTEKLRALAGAAAKAAVRRLYANAVQVEPDKQGRILIPKGLREYAALEHDVTVIGNLNHAEIWDSARYAEQDAKFSDEELAAALDEICF